MDTAELGVYGERLAENFLKSNGYDLVCRNYRFKHLELDLICQDEDQLVVIEVKTRQTSIVGEPYKAVTRTKQRQIMKAAHQYIVENNVQLEVRFDVVSIVHNSMRTDLEHIKNAFTSVG